MKVFIVAFALAALVASATSHLTEEQKLVIKKNHDICLQETNVDEAKVMKLRKDKDFSNKDEDLENFVFCMFLKCGMITPEGVWKEDVALSKIPEADRPKIKAVFASCSDIKGNRPQETVYLMAECYMKQVPDHPDIF